MESRAVTSSKEQGTTFMRLDTNMAAVSLFHDTNRVDRRDVM